MKIKSSNNEHYIEIKRNEINDFPYYDVSAKFREFSGSNDAISFDNLDEFIRDYDAFILDRSIAPKLTGTYDFELLIYCKNAGGSPRVKATISNVICDTPGNTTFGIFGEFEFDCEYLTSYLESFRGLA